MYLGYALRKMARELGLEVKDGVVCGILRDMRSACGRD